MKTLIVFDGTEQSVQNLQAALNRTEPEATLKIPILELLPEDAPLDDYLADMEERGLEYYKFIRQTVDQSGFPDALLEIWQGLEPEATQMVAHRATSWEAELIYVPLGKPCYICQETQYHGKLGFGHKKPLEESEPFTALVNPNSLSRMVNCPVAVTCHGDTILVLRNYLPESGRAEKFAS
ncbi:MAG TPA: hypothetical protein VH186_12805 [Chloroflexia bacterium]|nr:hypothetical protein [Chloroflexia bacterium]